MEEGFGFWWPPGQSPILYLPDGKQITLEVIDYIPYLRERESKRAVVAMPSPVALEADGERAPPPHPVRSRYQSRLPAPAPPASAEPRDKGGSADSSTSTSKGSAAEGTAEEPDEESQGSEEAPEVVPEWPDGVPMICGTCGHGDSKETRRLKAEAKSWKHELTHLPKDQCCL